jgi:hypothetical protein
MSRRPQPFISYAHEDQREAIRLYGDLRTIGAEPWLDVADLLPGDDWEHQIRRALQNSSHFIALTSKHSVNKRGFIQKELRQAFNILAEFPAGQIFLIPARLDELEPVHEEFKRIHRVDPFVDRDNAVAQIARSLGLQVGVHTAARTTNASHGVARRLWSRHQLRSASRSVSVGVNDYLPAYETIEIALRQRGIETWSI